MHIIQFNLDAHAKSRLLEIAASIIEVNKLTQFDTTELIVDHMTIAYKPDPDGPWVKWGEVHNGEWGNILVTGFGYNEKALAFSVSSTTIPSANVIKHITIAVANGGKPVDSNFIRDWRYWDPMDCITCNGKVKVI